MPISEKDKHQITFQELAKNDTILINSLDYYQLKNLGANDALVKAILKARPFYCIEQLERLQGYKTSEARHFEVFFHLPNTCPKAPIKRKYNRTLGLNSCTVNELVAIKKITAKTARRMVSFRNKLGGFYNKSQLEEIYEISDYELTILKTQNLSSSSIKKININTATTERLSKHPYLNKRQADNIVNYKKVIKRYNTKEDLYKLYLLDSNGVNKITPYLEF